MLNIRKIVLNVRLDDCILLLFISLISDSFKKFMITASCWEVDCDVDGRKYVWLGK